MQNLPKTCGIGLRTPHISELIQRRPNIGFLEVHSENYFGGGIKLKYLETLRETFELSFHGVGLSLGRADRLCKSHLNQLKSLIERFDPFLISEHLSWSAYAHQAVPDLLPLPFCQEALDIFCEHVDQFQSHIGRSILIENPSNYLAFAPTMLSEPEFITAITQKTGCKILLDINNIYVSSKNLGRDPLAYLDALPANSAIAQFHLAGHDQAPGDTEPSLLVDTHAKPVCEAVWELFAYALRRFGNQPTLIEWDTDVPELDVLINEARKADHYLERHAKASSHA